MRGRKPKPSRLRELEGNAGKRPLNVDEPPQASPDETFDAPPPQLAGAAADEWTRLAPMLRQSRQIGEADRSALLALCIEWARYLEAQKKVADLGLVVKTQNGYPMTNPYLTVASRALAACNKLWPELGLTPSSRSRVKTIGAASTMSAAQRFMAAAPKLRVVK